jgi:hypothetical protein
MTARHSGPSCQIIEVTATMPFKRKITTPEAPKRSSRKTGVGKRKVSQAGPARDRKSRAPHM